MKTPAAICISLLFFSFLLSCKPNPIEPVEPIVEIPEWRTHPKFNLYNKYQWVSYGDEQKFLALGNSNLHKLNDRGNIIGNDWKGIGFDDHQNADFRPILTEKYSVVQYQNSGYVNVLSNIWISRSTLFIMDSQVETESLYFPEIQRRHPKSNIGALINADKDTFKLVLFAYNESDQLGLLTLDCNFAETVNPRITFSGFHLLPLTSQFNAFPGFISVMGESVLVFVTSNDFGPSYGHYLYQWSLQNGFQLYESNLWPNGTIRTAFPSRDRSFTWVIAGDGNAYSTTGVSSTQLVYPKLSSANIISGKDLGKYISFHFNIGLSLFNKETGETWICPNSGFDGHAISDVSIYKDTLIVSSQTGDYFTMP